ncbi:hypothetical protein IU438_23560 [Nocardia cyriacigeorgica]|uniref:hypothetical protein n=1 Tax=Nocardia cyriacigeorgica TaxID=135487 RepID=UPI001894190C|nr:hypothetical protein [Nocardia cyriacigeorgica]MBF6398766.1 hypothetical protein [Nocardia cyriacigeorgica]MBF6403720.1 hypothetical protein [Nocardia cyriacigeorgica]
MLLVIEEGFVDRVDAEGAAAQGCFPGVEVGGRAVGVGVVDEVLGGRARVRGDPGVGFR